MKHGVYKKNYFTFRRGTLFGYNVAESFAIKSIKSDAIVVYAMAGSDKRHSMCKRIGEW